jgi:transposase-like protein
LSWFDLWDKKSQPVIGEVRIFPNDGLTNPSVDATWSAELLGFDAKGTPLGGLTSRFVKTKINLGAVQALVGQILASRHIPVVREFTDRMVDSEREAIVRKRRGGRPDAFYASIANEYIQLPNTGSRRPVADIAQPHGWKPSQVRDMIRQARERGLLSFFEWGRVGGQLTPLAQALLTRESDKNRKGSKHGRQRSRKN